jgi:hypothetical protein
MVRYREAADLAVKKAVLFATLAIGTTMMGMAFDFALSARAGAWMALMLTGALMWFAATAQKRKPEETETWMILPDEARPANPAARRVFCTVLQDTYLDYARRSFTWSIGLFAVAMVLRISGTDIGFK